MSGVLLMEPCVGVEGSLTACPLLSPTPFPWCHIQYYPASPPALQASAQLPAHSPGAGGQSLAAGDAFVSQISRTDGHSQEVSVLQRPQEPVWLWPCQLKAVLD